MRNNFWGLTCISETCSSLPCSFLPSLSSLLLYPPTFLIHSFIYLPSLLRFITPLYPVWFPKADDISFSSVILPNEMLNVLAGILIPNDFKYFSLFFKLRKTCNFIASSYSYQVPFKTSICKMWRFGCKRLVSPKKQGRAQDLKKSKKLTKHDRKTKKNIWSH